MSSSLLILQIISIVIMFVLTVLHFTNHYKFKCKKRKKTAQEQTRKLPLTSHRSSIIIYHNAANNNCCCCQIDISCGHTLNKYKFLESRDDDLQCYPMLFLFYLIFCVITAILSIMGNNFDQYVTFYCIILCCCWELLFNFYRFDSTKHCVARLAVKSGGGNRYYIEIFCKFMMYTTAFIIMFSLLLFCDNSFIFVVVSFLLISMHTFSNGYCIISFVLILMRQYEACNGQSESLLFTVKDSMLSAATLMGTVSVISCVLSAVYLTALIITFHFQYSVYILPFFPVFWSVSTSMFSMNFVRNRNQFYERYLVTKQCYKQKKDNASNQTYYQQSPRQQPSDAMNKNNIQRQTNSHESEHHLNVFFQSHSNPMYAPPNGPTIKKSKSAQHHSQKRNKIDDNSAALIRSATDIDGRIATLPLIEQSPSSSPSRIEKIGKKLGKYHNRLQKSRSLHSELGVKLAEHRSNEEKINDNNVARKLWVRKKSSSSPNVLSFAKEKQSTKALELLGFSDLDYHGGNMQLLLEKEVSSSMSAKYIDFDEDKIAFSDQLDKFKQNAAIETLCVDIGEEKEDNLMGLLTTGQRTKMPSTPIQSLQLMHEKGKSLGGKHKMLRGCSVDLGSIDLEKSAVDMTNETDVVRARSQHSRAAMDEQMKHILEVGLMGESEDAMNEEPMDVVMYLLIKQGLFNKKNLNSIKQIRMHTASI